MICRPTLSLLLFYCVTPVSPHKLHLSLLLLFDIMSPSLQDHIIITIKSIVYYYVRVQKRVASKVA